MKVFGASHGIVFYEQKSIPCKDTSKATLASDSNYVGRSQV